MVARPRELLRELHEGKEVVKALKTIKNQVIGNKFKKNAFISEGAVEQVLEVLRIARSSTSLADQAVVVQQQAAIVIGSLSLSDAGLRKLITLEGLPLLVAMLHSNDEAVIEAGIWALKMAIQQSSGAPYYTSNPPAGSDGNDVSSPTPSATNAPTAAAAAAAAVTPTAVVRLDAVAISAVVRCLAAGMSQSAASMGCSSGSGGSSDGGQHLFSGPRSGRGAVIAALAAAVIACCCRREEERDLAIAAGAPEGLLRLLLESERADTQAAALEGLSLTLPYQPSACALALARPEMYGRLFSLLRDPVPSVRLLAASCVATLSRMPDCDQSEAMQRAALPVLLRLLVQPATRPHVPAVLARLIEGSETLQKAAADADTVRLLAGLLAAEAAAAAATTTSTPSPAEATVAATPPTPLSPAAPVATTRPSAATADAGDAVAPGGGDASVCNASSRLREGCLRALGNLCLNRDDSRKQLLEAKVLRHIVRALEDPSVGVRSAAALCVRALTRCVRTLRGGLLEGGGELAPLLVGLLEDESTDVQVSAAAAVCNLVLDFSAAKSAVLTGGALPRLVSLATSPTSPSALRHHATWALANMLFGADSGVRVQLMQALPWPRMRPLLFDSDPRVVEQALVILRNLCMGDRHHISAALEWGACGYCGCSGNPTAAQQLLHRPFFSGGGGGGVSVEGGEPAEGESSLLDVLQHRMMLASASTVATAGATAAEGTDWGLNESTSAGSAPSALSRSHTISHTSQALYAMVNLLTGSPAVKSLVASRQQLLATVAAYLRPAVGELLALPAVWCVINLTWPAALGSGGSSGGGGGGGFDRELEAVASSCRALAEVGVLERLEELRRSHPSRDVQERAQTALEQLRAGLGSLVSQALVAPAVTSAGTDRLMFLI